MDNDKVNLYYDIIINFYVNNPELYDKVEEDYSVNASKVEKLTVLSNYLKQLHVNKEEWQTSLFCTWQELVKQFKQQLAAENSSKSGSGATSINFLYYNSLLFLKPACQSRQTLSTMNLSTNTEQCVSANHHDHSYMEAMPSTSTASCSTRRPLLTQRLDEFAIKKFKSIDGNEKDMKKIGQKLIETLDEINKRINSKENEQTMNESESINLNYRRLLTDAVNEIPAGQENNFLEIILEDLDKFDQDK